MTHVTIDELKRELESTLSSVATTGEPVIVETHEGEIAAIVSIESVELLESLEDKIDLMDALIAKAAHEKSGDDTVSLEDLAAELGLSESLKNTAES